MTSPTRSEEIEVKLPCGDLEGVRRRLREAGATLARPAHEESNILFDNAERGLEKTGCALRLRRAEGKAILTYKGPARFESGVKRRDEHETLVSDPGQTEAILAGAGLDRRFRYEKRREEWTLEECSIALDVTPLGSFVEIEGDPPDIRRAVVALDLDFASAIPYSYAKLYALRREKDPSLPEDMVFAEVKPET